MSRAHVREVDGDVPEDLPELPLSPHPNYVTPRGLAQLRARLDRVEQRLADLPKDAADVRQNRAQIERELRWLQARVASAQVVEGKQRNTGRAAFGAAVTIIDDNSDVCTYTIVGEDEAEPETGLISWTSPLARALIGAEVGDVVSWKRPAGDLDVTIRSIRYDDGGLP